MNKLVSIDEIAPIMKEQMEHGGKVVFTPKGNSMMPLFRSNKDIVTLISPKFPLKKYSIAFYQRQNGQYVLHRLVGRRGQYYIMRGDNQYVNEYNITQEQIIAVVSEFQRNGRSYNITDKIYKLYCLFWTKTMYIRKYYIFLRRTAGKVKRKLLRNK
ncbi:MAG: hypothetical protein HFG28_05595 [Eubacterium sp.]|nr:hypothetical protein [Eubacterium sp.]